MKVRAAAAALLAACLFTGAVAAGDVEHKRGLSQAHMAPAEPAREASLLEVVKGEDTSKGMSRLEYVLDKLQKVHEKTLTYKLMQKAKGYLKKESATFRSVLGQEPVARGRFEPTMMEILSVLVITLLIWLPAAYYYNVYHEMPAKDPSTALTEDTFKEFKWPQKHTRNEPYQCDTWICIWSFCVPSARWAKTKSVTGLMGFWLAFVIFVSLDVVTMMTGELLVRLLQIGVLIYGRQKLREKFNMSRQGGMTYLEDCCCYWWCMCCTVAQEAMHVEDGFKAGHPACKLPVEAKEEP